ncbi:MAG: biopolymer transporter ExbD [Verrucomicrobiota bacterium]
MKFKTGYENRKARVEMLPLIDVVFLLLVFFIYAMVSMVMHHGLKVDLPKAGTSQLDTRDYLNITITADNRILFGEAETTLENLVPLVEARLEETGSEAPIYIAGDRQAGLGIAVEILDRLRDAGIEKVSFSCSKEPQP